METLKRLILTNDYLLEDINNMGKAVFIPLSTEDEQAVIKSPLKLEVCPDCHGSGTELGHGLGGLVFTEEDVHGNEEFFEDMASGTFDTPCSKCKGRRVVTFPMLELLADDVLEKIFKVFEYYDGERRFSEAEAAGEQRMGC